MNMLPGAVAGRSFLLGCVLANHMRAESPRHLDAVQYELLHAVLLGITVADTPSRAAGKAVRSEGIGLAGFARVCRVVSPEPE